LNSAVVADAMVLGMTIAIASRPSSRGTPSTLRMLELLLKAGTATRKRTRAAQRAQMSVGFRLKSCLSVHKTL
jgi:hypothetical protein